MVLISVLNLFCCELQHSNSFLATFKQLCHGSQLLHQRQAIISNSFPPTFKQLCHGLQLLRQRLHHPVSNSYFLPTFKQQLHL